MGKTEKVLFETAFPFHLADAGKLIDFKFPGSDGTGEIRDLREDKYFNDFTPLWEDEKKYPEYVTETMRHSRSYCHHLLKREELLGYQILTVLNLAAFSRFFVEMRKSLEAGKFIAWRAEFLEMNFPSPAEPEAKRLRTI